MTGTERLIQLAIGAMQAAATVHVDLELRRHEQWRRAPAKGKRKWDPNIDRAAMVATFEDIFTAAVDAVKQEAQRDAGDEKT